MIKELDFEEIDQMMGEMGQTEGITSAIAADVAKVDNIIKKASSKSKEPAPKKTPSKKPATKKPTPKKPAAKQPTTSKTAKSDKGEIVDVKVLSKTQLPEAKIIPNPKVGKFMDIVSPLSDMSIKGQRPTKSKAPESELEAEPVVEAVAETAVIATTTELPAAPTVSADDLGLESLEDDVIEPLHPAVDQPLDEEPEGPVEELEPAAETVDDEDETIDSILENLENIPDESPTGTDEVNENLADILDIPDHSDAFLENVEIEKRPLGGNATVADSVGAVSVEKMVNFEDDIDEQIADQEFVADKPTPKWLLNQKPLRSVQPVPQKPAKTQPLGQKKPGNGILYILLIILMVILGAAVGAVAYFSGLL